MPKHQPPTTNRQPAPANSQFPNRTAALLCIVAALYLAALAACVPLILKHLGKLSLPGCGEASACDKALSSIYASVPLGFTSAPTAVIGASAFLGLAIGSLIAAWRKKIPTTLRVLASLAGLGSAFYLCIILIEGLACPYCLTAHACNLAATTALLVSFRPSRRPSPEDQRWPMWVTLIIPIAVLIPLLAVNQRAIKESKAKAAQDAAASTQQIIAKNTPTPAPPTKPFEGRFRFGPAIAPIRVVLFTDYQCPDCKRVEGELSELMKTRNDLAVSIKHFPLSAGCNPNIKQDMHPNACWAARAAESAGILGGVDGFWRMHEWLFARGGSFTNAELNAALPALGFDPTAFKQAINSPQTLGLVQADIQEGMQAGIYFTPMVFINGVEFRGWQIPGAVRQAILTVAASNPPAKDSTADTPPTAAEKHLEDWRQQPVRPLPPTLQRRTLGNPSASVRVTLIGDYQDAATSEADALLRSLASGTTPSIRYAFVAFPVNKTCNPSTNASVYPNTCSAHRAAEAVGELIGPEGFWRAHAWLFANRTGFTDAKLDQMLTDLPDLGVTAATLRETMAQKTVDQQIANDAAEAKKQGITSIPMIFINGRFVPRWKLGEENLLGRMIQEEAAKTASPSGGG
jgi:protein-disulfide isomerase/uncharacterized membrane protein